MNKQPARLHKQQDVSPNLNGLLLHPIAIIIAMMFGIVILSALVFAVTGHAAVESGSMRNFLATGV